MADYREDDLRAADQVVGSLVEQIERANGLRPRFASPDRSFFSLPPLEIYTADVQLSAERFAALLRFAEQRPLSFRAGRDELDAAAIPCVKLGGYTVPIDLP